jgi:hypothetical protein
MSTAVPTTYGVAVADAAGGIAALDAPPVDAINQAKDLMGLSGGVDSPVGFTWEHPAHRDFKPATSTELLFGGRRSARATVAARKGLS